MASRLHGERSTNEESARPAPLPPAPPLALLVDADENTARTHAAWLREDGFECRVVGSVEEAGESIQTEAPAVVIIGVHVQGASMHIATRQIRALVAAPTSIACMLAASRSDDAVEEALLFGADDVIAGSLHRVAWSARLRLLARVAQQARDLLRERAVFAAERAELQRQLHHDPLTGVANRAYVTRRLREEIDRSRRYGTPLTVIAIDIDHFKQVNDTHGHAIGDGVLRGVTMMLGRVIRTVDLLGRMGGEEFLILAPSTDAHGAAVFAERLRSALVAAPMIATAGSGAHVRLAVSASFGVACFDPASAHPSLSADLLLEAADAALYVAKQSGRNRVAFATL